MLAFFLQRRDGRVSQVFSLSLLGFWAGLCACACVCVCEKESVWQYTSVPSGVITSCPWPSCPCVSGNATVVYTIQYYPCDMYKCTYRWLVVSDRCIWCGDFFIKKIDFCLGLPYCPCVINWLVVSLASGEENLALIIIEIFFKWSFWS